MVVDENLNDISSSCIQKLKTRFNDACAIICILLGVILILAALFTNSLIERHRLNKENETLKEQLLKDETELSLEHSVGYWFINQPEQINDSILYAFLKDNNAWFPDILFKQAKIESSNYSSNIYLNTNNLYGMKKVGKRQTTQLNNTYKGYGCYNNWCLSVLDRMLWDMFMFDNVKPSKEEYLKAMSIYAEDTNYIKKIK